MSTGGVSLNESWTLIQAEHGITLPVRVPFDIHSTLIAAEFIGDPYWRDRELTLDWIHEAQWTLLRDVQLEAVELDAHWTLSFDSIDCVSTVRINGEIAGELASQFLRHDLNISTLLVAGMNHIEIVFHSNSQAANEAASAFPFELPWLSDNCRIGHTNHLRKTACHAGWDWNIALMPLGIYGDVQLQRSELCRLDDIKFVQRHEAGNVHVVVSVFVHGFAIGESCVTASLNGQEATLNMTLVPGENVLELCMSFDNPALWWPRGYGEQPLHVLSVQLGDTVMTRQIGFREVELITTPDDIGARFVVAVNGCEIFMRGANWIPADALPERCTPALVKNLLTSACDANMNMLRIWGGGQYEPDWFYDLCDKFGLLIWQDFMFACNHYPAANREWLGLIRREARQQVRRLSSHASLALWCGDNELIGALNWFDITRANRDRYLANYTILNHALEETIEAENIDVPFWPSSPSSGRLDFGDAWHDDRSGDMHFWDVWHSAREFEHYRSVRPRFCSEFGFQSLPSLPVIERFSEPEDRNISSRVMDIHQRNVGGNSRIVETLSRYFRFPDSFTDMVFLSQVSQGLAMQTAIEFWRSNKPRTMGTLYWQLNDTWPVASWSSLEHGGGWKICHYLARRFYAPVLLSAQPDADTGETVVWAIADQHAAAALEVTLTMENLNGGRERFVTTNLRVPTDRAIEVARLASDAIPDQVFLRMDWVDTVTGIAGQNTYLPHRFKHYDLPKATVSASWQNGENGPELVLETDAPAFYVTIGLGESLIYSDNAFTLLPGLQKIVRPLRDCHDQGPIPEQSESVPTIQHLTGSSPQ